MYTPVGNITFGEYSNGATGIVRESISVSESGNIYLSTYVEAGYWEAGYLENEQPLII